MFDTTHTMNTHFEGNDDDGARVKNQAQALAYIDAHTYDDDELAELTRIFGGAS